MADRTVRVVLTGNVGPYVSSMQQAARQTQAASRQIATSAQQAANNSSAALQRMSRMAETHTARASSALNRSIANTASQMNGLGARGAGALNQVSRAAAQASQQVMNSSSAALAQMARMTQAQTARASAAMNSSVASTAAQMNGLGAVGAASMNRVGIEAINAASAMRNSMTAAAASSTQAINSTSAALARMTALAQTETARAASALNTSAAASAAQMAGLGAAGAAAINRVSADAIRSDIILRRASEEAAAATTSRWASAWMAVSGGARFAAVTVGQSMLQVANNSQRSLKAARTASLGLLAAFALAAAAAARFDKAMAEVRAVTDGSAQDMQKLSRAALQASKATIYSASQAANAEAELARAGVSTADIIGGALKGSLALAASGQLDLGDSAIIAAQAMNAFKLSGRDVGHIADVISAGAGKSATDVHHLGMAFRQAALLSSQTGLSLEQTVGTLSLFAQNALTGSDAGTSLKVMLQRLTPQSKEAQQTMDKLGFSAYDAQGNFIGLSALADMMKASFSNLTPEARNAALGVIFGSDAVRAATILYQAGASGVNSWVRAVDDAGYASRVAGAMTNNLSGDLSKLKNSLEAALIESGSSANSALRSLAQSLTNVVNWYSQLPPAMQKSVTVGAGLVGMLGLISSGLLLMLPRIMAVRAELIALGVTGARVRGILAGLGRLTVVLTALTAMTWGVRKLTDAFREAPPNATKMANSLVDLAQKGKAAGELTKTFGESLDGFGEAVKRIAHPGGLDRVADFFSTFDPMAEGAGDLEGARERVKALDEALTNLVRSGATQEAAAAFQRMAAEAEKQGTSTDKLRTLLPGYSEALAEVDTQNKVTAGSQKQLGDAAAQTADQIADQRSEAEKLSDALNALNGVAISAAEKEIAFRGSLQSLTEAVKENGHSLSVTSEKGRAVKSAFLDAASAAMAHAQAVAEQQNSVEAGNAVLAQDIALLRRQMLQAGFSAAAVNTLIGAYAKLPAAKSTDVRARGAAEAAAEVMRLRGHISALTGKTVTVTTVYRIVGNPNIPDGTYHGSTAGRSATGGLIRGYASGGDVRWQPFGGPVWGPGTGTSDSIPTWLSRGEYVIKAASVRRYGLAMMDRLNAGRYAAGGYAGGGFTYTPSGPPVLGGTRNPMERYNNLVGYLKDAWEAYRKAVDDLRKLQHDKKATKQQKQAAQQKVTQAWAWMKVIDQSLGVKVGSQVPKGLDLNAYQKQLTDSLAATERWRANLNKIGSRGGSEIRDILEGMGEEGYALVNQLAGASDKQFKDIVAKLKKLGGLAKATLTDFTSQLSASTAKSQQFAADLQTLAARGFGDLAQMLASQGDEHAAELARQAVTGKGGEAAKANDAAKKASSGLTGEELAESLVLLSTLRGAPGRGISDVIGAGLSWSQIRDLAPKVMGQINSLPPEFRQRFVSQLVGQGVIPAMARGGILTSPMVLAGEAGPEAYIPINGSSRSRALLAQTAQMLGYDARPASSFGGSGGGGSSVHHGDRTTHITLNGARQSSAEQLHDLARHLQFAG